MSLLGAALRHRDRVNLLVRAGAEVTGLAIGLVTTVWVSRVVGPTYFGYYAVMVTVVTLGAILINGGLSTAGSQRVANEPAKAGEILWVVTVSRAIIAAAGIVGALILLVGAPIDPILRGYLQVGIISWAVLPFRSEWVLVAQGRVRTLSGIRIAASSASLLVAVLFVRDASNAGNIAWVFVSAAIVGAVGSSLGAQQSSRFRRPAEISLAVRAYFADGLDYLKSDASMFIFTSSDRLFLYVFATPAVVGLYEAAYRVIQPLYLISNVVTDAMYLQLARAYKTDHLAPTLRRYVDLMCFGTIPLGFFLLAFAPLLVATIYGTKYMAASPYLAVLGWVITFGYMSGIAVIPFSAWNRPREYGNSTAFGGVLNLGLNFLLIPPYGGLGAAWATVAAKVAVTLAGIRYFRRVTDYPVVRDFLEYLFISAAAFFAAIITRRLLPDADVTAIIAFGLVYVSLVGIVRWRRHGPRSTGDFLRSLPSRRSVSDEQSGPQ